jgi:hypothetical protein
MDYDEENWYHLYSKAIIELERTDIATRISAARLAMVNPLQQLEEISDTHTEELRSTQDALSNLRNLEIAEGRDSARERNDLARNKEADSESIDI